jgi:hypothetical protein
MYRTAHPAKRYFPAILLSLAGTVLGAGSCVETDIGAPCQVQNNIGTEACRDRPIEEAPECYRPSLDDFRDDALLEGGGVDYVAFGVAVCDNLTCVRSQGEPVPDSHGAPSGYCSGECINDDDCSSDLGSFECRSLVLDDDFLESLRESLSEEEVERYLGRIQTAKYCARKP